MTYTYFISDGEYVKIGRSSNPAQRLAALRTSSARELSLVGLTVEAEGGLHERFSAHRVNGEWFVFAEEIRNHVASLVPVAEVEVSGGATTGKTFRLPDWLITAIDERARRENRTASQVARIVLEKEFRKKKRAA